MLIAEKSREAPTSTAWWSRQTPPIAEE